MIKWGKREALKIYLSYHIIIMGNLGRSVTNTLAMVMSLVLVNRGVMYMKTYNEKLYNHI